LPASRSHSHARTPAPAGSPAAPGRRERHKLEVYRRIHEAAVNLFRQRGYDATTVEQIAERADVAKGTVFNYFPSKESLLHALSADIHLKLLEELGTADSWSGPARRQVARLLDALARLAEEDRVVFRLVLGQNLREFWRDAQQDPLSQHVQTSVRVALRRGRASGELDARVRLESAARLIEAAFFTTMLDWLNGGIAEGAFRREVAGQLDIVFAGLARRG
jgi:TetR/AcrR family transcriptional regulator, cholesterol catabolism regulator